MCVVVLLIVWHFLPSRAQPKTDRFDLVPVTAVHVMSTRDVSRLSKQQESYFPIYEVPKWLALAGVTRQDLNSLAIVNIPRSAVLILELNRPAAEVFTVLQRRLKSPGRIGTHQTVQFPSPVVKSGPQPWCWAVANERTIVVGHTVGVGEVLLTATGDRLNIRARRVLRPLLADFESDVAFDLRLVPESDEATMIGAQALVQKFSQIPGAHLLVGGRGMGMSLGTSPSGCIAKLDFQYKGRASALLVSSIFRVFRILGGPSILSSSKKDTPREFVVERKGGLVALHLYFDAARCEEAQREDEAVVNLFPEHHHPPTSTPKRRRR
jgi:hypothetical protein